ncbi:FAS1-like dehydratase domain-containing protein [Actinomadura bangladeshensis]|nr:MaoC family dehydratase N-terminal domain-containing protein [Actinomadura bangladeshensis]
MSAPPSTLISEAMSAKVGAEVSRRVSFPVSASDVRKWAMAVYYPKHPPRRYWDAEYVERELGGRWVAPHEFNPFAWMTADPPGFPEVDRLDPDLLEKTLGIAGPGLKFQLNGGLDVEYHGDIVAGDVITAVRVLEGYTERSGRLGQMLFTTNRETWTNQRGETVQVRRQTGIRY